MDITSIEGLLVVLLFIFPGAVGDIAMREFLNMLPPRSDFRQLTSALAWSLLALLTIEGVSSVSGSTFGSYLIQPAVEFGSNAETVGPVASRWVVFALVAAFLPWFVRWVLLRPVMALLEKMGLTFRTLQASSLDQVLKMAHEQSPGGVLPARITTEEFMVEGTIIWSTQGREEDAALILQKSSEDKSLTWVPARSMVSLELFDDPSRLSVAEEE